MKANKYSALSSQVDLNRSPNIFSEVMFPEPDDITKATDRHEFRTWLEIAEKKAELPKLNGALWHAYRRG